ncbi:helix-turn-helix domain-containing protein [Pedobacter rhodius]|uniref:AraC family transcriptional regulator n=1 Tax=Pedobacter rhodius TaxID=3004098 RepID=A0ABT4KY09_9SPHI|nr:AraC family transcriptional regulator [Pedobacter sp. SJ11]MCZ4223815.1 AraC family transcriptional regulator [Pedobacter sp. SJ11]
MNPVFLGVIGAIFIFSVVIVKLFLYGHHKRQLSILLSISVTGIIWYALIYLLTNSGEIRNYPSLFNKGLPLYYLIAPCLFLYIRGSLNESFSELRRKDFLHLILIIPAILDVLPYNLLSNAEQQIIVDRIATDLNFAFSRSRYIVNPLHWLAFPASACVYTCLQVNLIHKASKTRSINHKNVIWLYFFTAICGLIFFGILAIDFSVLNNVHKAWFMLNESNLVFLLCFCLLTLSFLFFLNPEFIYGLNKTGLIRVIKEPQIGEKIIPNLKSEKTDFKARKVDDNLIGLLENFINDKQIFRQAGLTLSEFASLINVPNHKLTEVFNQHYKVNFNSYINNLRIEYVKERLDSGDWKQFTLEAIAKEAGFSSRNTFFLAFKKATGSTPSVYIANLKRK